MDPARPSQESEGGPGLALLARLAEAARWDDQVRRYEDDPWAYLRRKLLATEGPLRELKSNLFRGAQERLFEDLAKPFLAPGSLQTHKETFESLLSIGDFVDLSLSLEVGRERESRLEGARAILDIAKIPTLFDMEAQPPERRSRAWQARVEEAGHRLGLDLLARLAERGEATPRRKAYLALRLRRELGEALTMTRHDCGLRDEVTPYVLSRLEATTAAALRFLSRWR